MAQTDDPPFPVQMQEQIAVELGNRARQGIPLPDPEPEIWFRGITPSDIPFPGSAERVPSPPDRRDVEELLLPLARWAESQPLSGWSVARFIYRFLQSAGLPPCDARSWRRLAHRQASHLQKRSLAQIYRTQLHFSEGFQTSRFTAFCPQRGDPTGLLQEVETSADAPVRRLKTGSRATLWEGRLQDQAVIIKRYEPNPRRWRRLVETNRARRAWAGACVLQKAGFQVPEPVGWLCVTNGPEKGTGYFISKPLEQTETVRAWLRREWPRLSREEQIQVRYELRKHLLRLFDCGLFHVDCKLSNLRIPKETSFRSETLIWTDLEDIRPRPPSTRSFIRNLYQLNGSLPRFIPREDRIRFLHGFQSRFSIATSPRLAAYITRVTRKRHQRELRRECGA